MVKSSIAEKAQTERTSYTEQQYLAETKEHIMMVQSFLLTFIELLSLRAREHDKSKLAEPEKSIFVMNTPLLDGVIYGSPEYERHRERVSVALRHHYKHNRHHPEFHENGIRDMNLVDIVEMFVDWVASAIKYGNDIRHSINVCQQRFEFSDDLKKIFENTISLLRTESISNETRKEIQ